MQKMAASTYPQGSGWATAVVGASGLMAVSGELADGERFALSQYLSKDNRLPFYIAAYRGTGAFGGEVSFRDVPGQSDADGMGLRWFKPPLAADALYPGGRPSGIRVDLLGSKFLKYIKQFSMPSAIISSRKEYEIKFGLRDRCSAIFRKHSPI